MTATNLAMTPEQFPGVNVLLMGPPGTGKTYSLATAVEAGIEVFYLGLENGLESLLAYWTERELPIPANLHWHIQDTVSADWAEMISQATRINTLNLEMLAKGADPARGKYDAFIHLLKTLNNFPDDRTGKEFGAVDTWDNTRMLAIDGLSGLVQFAITLVIGGKPVRSPSDYGIGQEAIMKLIHKLCDGARCHFTLLAHVERETDQILGGVKLTVASLGKALNPVLPSKFSDVILTVRDGVKWTWDTANPMADIKTRNLAFAAGQNPSFATILATWKKRRDAAMATATATATDKES